MFLILRRAAEKSKSGGAVALATGAQGKRVASGSTESLRRLRGRAYPSQLGGQGVVSDLNHCRWLSARGECSGADLIPCCSALEFVRRAGSADGILGSSGAATRSIPD